MKRVLLLPLALLSCLFFYAQTSVPDSNFEQALIDLGYDTGPTDGFVPTANINTVTVLSVPNLSIQSLVGIEDFTMLETLNCSGNDIVTLDLQSNMNLTHVYCYYNSLTSLTLPNTNTLQQLEFYNNFLTGGIDLSPYTNLTFLRSYNNPSLGTLDVSNSPDLQYLYCHNNGLNALDVTQNPDLEVLDCYNNNITTLDVSNNLALWRLWCHDNNLTTLDVNLNTSLQTLYCYLNDITSLTLPTTPTLTNLRCQANDLPSLDASGLTGLESLRCFNNPTMTSLTLPSTNTLTYVDCSSTDIGSLNASSLMGLNYLDVYYCYSLTNLMLPPTPSLQSLWAYSTGLSNLNFTSNTGLQNMDIANGNFTTIDVSMLPGLVQFYCNENSSLTSLDISNNSNDILGTLWADDNPLLTCIEVDDVADANSRDPNDWRKDVTASYSESCALTTNDFEGSEITLYPNPVKNILTIGVFESITYTVVDVFGKEVLYGKLLSGLNQLEVSNLNNGIYFINLKNDKASTTKKFLKY
jgi:hypothetical protein